MPADTRSTADAFADPRATIPSCAIGDEDLARQRERQRLLAPSVRGAERKGRAVTIEFEPGFDREALDQLIAVERSCCPFFAFELDGERRRLTVSVRDGQHAAALDAIAAMLGVTV
jgi:hypothetical protein